MKNQYFGDFGDYQKFSLLKILRDVGRFKITIHWMKTKDDDSTDGKRISYLDKPEIYSSFEPQIFDFIKEHIDSNRRDLALYEQSRHSTGINFINDHIEDPAKRLELLKAICEDKISDLVFFDPDNGIEVKSSSPRTLHKYVLWSEIEEVFKSNKSILVYQHFSRKNRELFIEEKLLELKGRFQVETFAIQVKHSVYFLLAQESHLQKINKSLDSYLNIWKSLAAIRK